MIHSRMPRRTVATIGLMLTALLTGGCFFDTGLSVSVHAIGEEVLGVFISTNSSVSHCSPLEGTQYECAFFSDEGPISRFSIESLPEFLHLLILIDPMVVQFPAEAGGFAGSFLHHDTGTNGSLAIASGLASVPVDDTRTLVAEPGTQFVILELPPGAPTTGDFAFNLNFAVPPGTSEVVTKPLFTGRIELADGSVFYPPLFPCVSDMAEAPALTIPLPAPGDTVNLPQLGPGLGCDGEIYLYGAAGGGVLEIPTLGLVGLAAMALLLGGIGWLVVRR
jgi:hypothetical protein